MDDMREDGKERNPEDLLPEAGVETVHGAAGEKEPSMFEKEMRALLEEVRTERARIKKEMAEREALHAKTLDELTKRREAPNIKQVTDTYKAEAQTAHEKVQRAEEELQKTLESAETRTGQKTEEFIGPKSVRHMLEDRLKSLENAIDKAPRFSPEQEELFAKHKAVRYEITELDRTKDQREFATLQAELGRRESLRLDEDAREEERAAKAKEEQKGVENNRTTTEPETDNREEEAEDLPKAEPPEPFNWPLRPAVDDETDQTKADRLKEAEKARELDALRMEYERVSGLCVMAEKYAGSPDAVKRAAAKILLARFQEQKKKTMSDITSRGGEVPTEPRSPVGDRALRLFQTALEAVRKEIGDAALLAMEKGQAKEDERQDARDAKTTSTLAKVFETPASPEDDIIAALDEEKEPSAPPAKATKEQAPPQKPKSLRARKIVTSSELNPDTAPTRETVRDMSFHGLYDWMNKAQALPGEEGEDLQDLLREEMQRRLDTADGWRREMTFAKKNDDKMMVELLEAFRTKHFPDLAL